MNALLSLTATAILAVLVAWFAGGLLLREFGPLGLSATLQVGGEMVFARAGKIRTS